MAGRGCSTPLPLSRKEERGERKKKKKSLPSPNSCSPGRASPRPGMDSCLERQMTSEGAGMSRALGALCPFPEGAAVRGVRLRTGPSLRHRGRVFTARLLLQPRGCVLISSCRKGFLPPPGFVHKVLSHRWGHGSIGRERIPGSS